MVARTRIAMTDLTGLPGLRRAAADALVARQPATVAEALAIADVGRKTTKQLLLLGLLTDPEGVQRGSLARRTRSLGRSAPRRGDP